MTKLASSMSGTHTYVIGVLMVLYAVIFRGFGANDWSGATIMMFIAIIGMSLQYSISARRDIAA